MFLFRLCRAHQKYIKYIQKRITGRETFTSISTATNYFTPLISGTESYYMTKNLIKRKISLSLILIIFILIKILQILV